MVIRLLRGRRRNVIDTNADAESFVVDAAARALSPRTFAARIEEPAMVACRASTRRYAHYGEPHPKLTSG
jgi:hypothetical protein